MRPQEWGWWTDADSCTDIVQRKTLFTILSHFYSIINSGLIVQPQLLTFTTVMHFLGITYKFKLFHLSLRFNALCDEQYFLTDYTTCWLHRITQHHSHMSADLTQAGTKLMLNLPSNSINYPKLLFCGEQLSLSYPWLAWVFKTSGFSEPILHKEIARVYHLSRCRCWVIHWASSQLGDLFPYTSLIVFM